MVSWSTTTLASESTVLFLESFFLLRKARYGCSTCASSRPAHHTEAHATNNESTGARGARVSAMRRAPQTANATIFSTFCDEPLIRSDTTTPRALITAPCMLAVALGRFFMVLEYALDML